MKRTRPGRLPGRVRSASPNRQPSPPKRGRSGTTRRGVSSSGGTFVAVGAAAACCWFCCIIAGGGHDAGGAHGLHHGAGHHHHPALLLEPLVKDVHLPQPQGDGVGLVRLRRLLEQLRDLHLGLAQDDARLLLARGLRLARHGVLQRRGDHHVAHLHRVHAHAPGRGALVDQRLQLLLDVQAPAQQLGERGAADDVAQRCLRGPADGLPVVLRRSPRPWGGSRDRVSRTTPAAWRGIDSSDARLYTPLTSCSHASCEDPVEGGSGDPVSFHLDIAPLRPSRNAERRSVRIGLGDDG